MTLTTKQIAALRSIEAAGPDGLPELIDGRVTISSVRGALRSAGLIDVRSHGVIRKDRRGHEVHDNHIHLTPAGRAALA